GAHPGAEGQPDPGPYRGHRNLPHRSARRQAGLAGQNFVGRLPDSLEWGPAAPILCAGVTVYKALKETEVKPGEWVVISGIGGLGHMADQYAKAMGMHVAAVDVHPDKLELAKSLGAEIALSAVAGDVAAEMQKLIRGAHGALVTAVSPN